MKPRFLIVDDDQMSREMLQLSLDEYADCATAEDGKDALQKIKEAIYAGKPFALICTDIQMPVLDGVEFLRELRHMNITQPKVFVISASTCQVSLRDVYFDGACDDYLIKPINPKLLKKLLERHELLDAAE